MVDTRNILNPNARHGQAFELASDLVEEVRLISKTFPEDEDMVLVPEVRQAVMAIHSAVMMVATADNDEDYYHYLGDIRGKSARLHTQMHFACNAGYIHDKQMERLSNMLDEIHELTDMPRRANLELVKDEALV